MCKEESSIYSIEGDIVTILNREVKRIQKEKGYKKNYGREFHISILQEVPKGEKQFGQFSLLLNVQLKDTGLCFSRKIFPKDEVGDIIYGLPPLEEEMKYLFNTTM